MKVKIKIAILWLCVVTVLVGHGLYKYSTGGVAIGSDRTAFYDSHPDAYRFSSYSCYRNQAGNLVVVSFKGGTVSEIYVMDASFSNPSHFRFGLISEGMSLPSVIGLVGLPLRLNYAGVNRTLYVTSDYANYGIHWETDYTNGGVTVTSVAKDIDKRISADWIAENADIAKDIRFFPMLQLVPWVHNLLDGAIVWAAILYTEKLKTTKKKTAEAA